MNNFNEPFQIANDTRIHNIFILILKLSKRCIRSNFTVCRNWAYKYNNLLNKYIAIWEAYGCNLSNWTRLISHTTFTIHNAPAQIFVRFETLDDTVECGRDVLHRTWKKIKYILRTLTEQQSSKFCNFWAISSCNSSKESIFLIEFNFTKKKYDLFEKKLKKSNFSDFFVKTDSDHLSSIAYFSNLCQKISKLSLSVLWRGFEIKSHQRWTHYL